MLPAHAALTEPGDVATMGTNLAGAPLAVAEDTGEEGVEIGGLDYVDVLLVARNQIEVEVEADPVDGVAGFGGAVQMTAGAHELVVIAHVLHQIALMSPENDLHLLDHLKAARLAREAVVFKHAVEAAHHLVRLAPATKISVIPVCQRLAGRGVGEEVRLGVSGTVPIGDDLLRVVEEERIARLAVEHHERLENGAAGHARHRRGAGVAELDAKLAHHRDLLDHRLLGRTQDLAVARGLVDHQQSPHRVLAAPEVPAPVRGPAKHLLRELGIVRHNEGRVGVGAEIAIRLLVLHQTVRLLAEELRERRIIGVLGDAGRGDHQFAPELALPHAERRIIDIVVRIGEGLASLAHDNRAGEVRPAALIHEFFELCADFSLHARVLQRGGVENVFDGILRQSRGADRNRGHGKNRELKFHARILAKSGMMDNGRHSLIHKPRCALPFGHCPVRRRRRPVPMSGFRPVGFEKF